MFLNNSLEEKKTIYLKSNYVQVQRCTLNLAVKRAQTIRQENRIWKVLVVYVSQRTNIVWLDLFRMHDAHAHILGPRII